MKSEGWKISPRDLHLCRFFDLIATLSHEPARHPHVRYIFFCIYPWPTIHPRENHPHAQLNHTISILFTI